MGVAPVKIMFVVTLSFETALVSLPMLYLTPEEGGSDISAHKINIL